MSSNPALNIRSVASAMTTGVAGIGNSQHKIAYLAHKVVVAPVSYHESPTRFENPADFPERLAR